jgi:signal transduction histidine kinase
MRLPEDNRRILIIDDNPSLQKDFRKILSGTVIESPLLDEDERVVFGRVNGGSDALKFELETAFQGEEGLAKVQTASAEGRPFALAFVDVRMPPGWDGVETIARLWEVDPHLEVVICTAYSDYSWTEIEEKLGRLDQLLILKKPFEDIEVLQMARALTDKWNLGCKVRRNVEELERRVAERTQQLEEQIVGREHAERQHLLEAERSRLARDLHDELGASLTEISLLANVGAGTPPCLEKAAARFRLIADKAGGVVDALDVIVWAVNPATDALQPLADYVSSFVREFLSASEIRCRLKVPIQFPPATLDSHARHNLFLAVKETVNNAARHSSAREVEFRMAVVDGCLQITVTDNGVGFDTCAASSGMGLANLRRRLEAIGGQCSIESRRGSGTSVTMFVPLPAERFSVGPAKGLSL